jgi:hypothetical protein
MIIRTVAATLLAFVATACTAQPGLSYGLIGQPLATAKTNELFTFFNLAQTGSGPCGAGQQLEFRPTGAQFHALAAVEAVTDAHGDVAAMALILDRGFVNDPVNGIFAADIAKSFIGDVSSPQTPPPFSNLAKEIQAGAASRGMVISNTAAGATAPPGPPSAAYQVFLGQKPSAILTPNGEALGLANEQQGGKPVLTMQFSRGGAAPACAMGELGG